MGVRIDILTEGWEPFEPDPGEKTHYVLADVAQVWGKAGHDVRVLRGVPARGAEADVCVQRVDQTRTPPACTAYVAGHRVAVNAGVTDISKRAISRALVLPGDGYEGPVIVKSDLNTGGGAEREVLKRRGSVLGRLGHSARRRLPWTLGGSLPVLGYRVFERRAEVPRSVWWNRDLVVERLVTERREGLYWLRSWLFLGDRGAVRFDGSEVPLIKVGHIKVWRFEDQADPAVLPEAVRKRRAELGMQFGKLDFVVTDEETLVFDVNRTPTTMLWEPEHRWRQAELLAGGLDALLGGV